MWLRLDARPFPSTGVTPLLRYGMGRSDSRSALAHFTGMPLIGFMLRTGKLHPPKEGLTPRYDAQVSPNVGGLLQR